MNSLQNEIYKYLKERDWLPNKTKRTVSAYAKSISIEAAELLQEFQWDESKYDREAVLDELGDVLIYCIDMSIALNMNVEDIVRRKLEKVKLKYPK